MRRPSAAIKRPFAEGYGREMVGVRIGNRIWNCENCLLPPQLRLHWGRSLALLFLRP